MEKLLLRSVCRCVLQHKTVLGPQQLQVSNRILTAPQHPRSPQPATRWHSSELEEGAAVRLRLGAAPRNPRTRGQGAVEPIPQNAEAAAAMLPSIPQSPRLTGLKHRTGKEFAALFSQE